MRKKAKASVGMLMSLTLKTQGKSVAWCARQLCTDKITMKQILDGFVMPTKYQAFLFGECTGVKIEIETDKTEEQEEYARIHEQVSNGCTKSI